MYPVRCDGKRIGYADVVDGRVIRMDLEEGWILNLPKGDHEVRIELDTTFEVDPNTGDGNYVMNYLSSKFTL